MNDSDANVICGPFGSRRLPVRSGVSQTSGSATTCDAMRRFGISYISDGVPAFTTRHWSVEVLVALAVVTEADALVKAAGLPEQLVLVCVAALVSPETVTVQLVVPAVIAIPVRPERTRVAVV